MRLDIRYRSSFTYDGLVRESQNELRACPCTDEFQQLISYRVTTSPTAKVVSSTDYWGTRVDAFGTRAPHSSLEVLAEATVDTRDRPLPMGMSRPELLVEPAFVDRHAEYLERTPHADWGPEIVRLAAEQTAAAGGDVVGWVLALHRLVGATLRYERGVTSVGVPVDEVLAHGHGVCQDFAHLAVALCRSRGVPARYVSGYLFTRDETTLPPADAAEDPDDAVRVQTHAWFEAAIPGHGWFALDPTNQTAVGQRHVKIGHGRDYADVQPLRGVFSGGAGASVTPDVEIRRLPVVETAAVPPPGRLLLEQDRRDQQRQQQQQ
ncbi:MAG: transglutaminase family protein [Acidobacteria bacterium]|nr:transglutaminase family protein [Acidobacteriota bacterium]